MCDLCAVLVHKSVLYKEIVVVVGVVQTTNNLTN